MEYSKITTLPQGVKDILPQSSAKMRFVEEGILNTLSKWGYRLVTTPLLEYEDVLSRGIDNELKKEILKFIDPESGRVMALRPDITPQIARMVVSKMRSYPLPIRLCYNESIFRWIGQPTLKRKEIFQVGAELIGLGLPEADGEIVAMAIEALKALGLQDFKIDIGQVDFLKGILENIEVEEDTKKAIMRVISLKDRSGLEEVLKDLPLKDRKKKLLLEFPNLYGKGVEVLKKASVMVKNRRSRDALNNLDQILKVLELYGLKDFITVDLGEVKGFDYYSGMLFEGFVKGMGKGVVKGGRYNGLLARYGYPCPAIGFAFDTEGVLYALESQKRAIEEEKIDFLLFNAKKEKREALMITRFLREKGYKVARDIIKRDYETSLKYSKKNGIVSIISLGLNGLKDDEVMLDDVDTRKKKKIKIKDIFEGRVL